MESFDPNNLQRLQAIRQATPTSQTLLRKLVHDSSQGRNSAAKGKSINLNRYGLESISNQTAQDVIDSDSIMQMLPDLELAEQILVGSILSPKDMSSTDLQYIVAEGQFEGAITGLLLEVPTQYFKRDYKIDDRLDLQLEQILTTRGAWISVILPENNIDAIINGQPKISLEHLDMAVNRSQTNRQLGILGHPAKSSATVSLEDFGGNLDDVMKIRTGPNEFLSNVTVTDNFNILKKPAFRERRRNLLVNEKLKKLNVSMESATANLSLTNEQIDELYRDKVNGHMNVQVITPQMYMETPSVGHPLPLELPIESLMPVSVPGKPEEHVGYLLLLDNNNRPVSKANSPDHYNQMRNAFTSGSGGPGGQKDSTSELIRLTRQAMGASDNVNQFEMEQIYQTYSNILENDLQNRLRNGIYGEELDIGFTEEVMRTMLYRQFKNQNTQILYIPAELVVYVAFNYNKHGIGQTLLAKSKILSNMRSVLLFAETMAGVRNAVGRKKVNITLDPKDPDKMDTLAKIQEMILETTRNGFPIGSPDPSQSMDFLHRAGFDFAVTADSPDFGNTKVEFDDFTTNIQAGNPELQRTLQRMQVSAWGVPPEKVDPTASPDFAVGVVNNDLIMTRRVKRYQRIFCLGQTKFVRTYTLNSSILMGRLIEVVDNNRDKLTPEQAKKTSREVAEDFIAALEAKLPEPDTTRIDLMAQAFNQFNDLLTQAMDAYVTPDLFPDETFPDAQGAADRFKQILIAHFKRQYLNQNNILPELNVLHEIDGDKPAFNILDMQSSYQKTLGTAFNEFIQQEGKMQEEWRKKFPRKDEGGGGDAFSTPSTDTLTGGMDDVPAGDGQDDIFSGDELSMDLPTDLNDEETPGSDTTGDSGVTASDFGPQEVDAVDKTDEEVTPPAEEEQEEETPPAPDQENDQDEDVDKPKP